MPVGFGGVEGGKGTGRPLPRPLPSYAFCAFTVGARAGAQLSLGSGAQPWGASWGGARWPEARTTGTRAPWLWGEG